METETFCVKENQNSKVLANNWDYTTEKRRSFKSMTLEPEGPTYFPAMSLYQVFDLVLVI